MVVVSFWLDGFLGLVGWFFGVGFWLVGLVFWWMVLGSVLG
jgi:hypothetical protein